MQRIVPVQKETFQKLILRLIEMFPTDITEDDILNLLASRDFRKNYHNFLVPPTKVKKVFAKEIIANSEKEIVVGERFVLVPNYRLSLNETGDKNITDKHFPFGKKRDAAKITIRLHIPEEGDSTEKVIEDMAEERLRQIDIRELEALRLSYPNLEWPFAVVGLGSTTGVRNVQMAPMISKGKPNEGLQLCNIEIGWSPKICRIAGVEI